LLGIDSAENMLIRSIAAITTMKQGRT